MFVFLRLLYSIFISFDFLVAYTVPVGYLVLEYLVNMIDGWCMEYAYLCYYSSTGRIVVLLCMYVLYRPQLCSPNPYVFEESSGFSRSMDLMTSSMQGIFLL